MGRQWYIDHAVKFARWKHPVMGLGARFAVLHHLFQVLFYDFGVFANYCPSLATVVWFMTHYLVCRRFTRNYGMMSGVKRKNMSMLFFRLTEHLLTSNLNIRLSLETWSEACSYII